MAENQYRVGQVLYIIPVDSAIVVPVQIAERRISETSAGTVVKHIIKSSKPKSPPMVLETVKGMIFVDLRQARDFMMKNAATAIDSMIRDALAVAKRAFAPAKEPEQDVDPLASADLFVDDDQSVQITEEQEQTTNNVRQITQPARNLAIQPDISPDGTTEVMGPDGKMQRVRIRAQ